MKISRKPAVISGIISVVFVFVAIVAPVSAIDSTVHMGRPPLADSEDSNGLPTVAKLSDAKLRACQNREKAINNIMSRIANRGEKQIDVFNKIATRVEKFYADKNLSLSNYDALIADVNAKKTAANDAVDAVKSSSVSFKCDGTDPKGAAQAFQGKLKNEVAALKAYKTSVKNLIVGVKSVAGSTSSSESTEGTQ